MTKWFRWIAPVTLLLVLATLYFLSNSTTGLRCLVSLCNHLCAGRLTMSTASGSLFGSLRLQGLRYTDSTDTVAIENVTVTWDPSQLWSKQFQIDSISIEGVRVTLGPSTQDPIVLPPFSLPIRLLIQKISVEKIAIASGQKEMVLIPTGTIKQLSLQGQNLAFEDLSLTTEETNWQAKGQMETTKGYPLQLQLVSQYHPAGYESFSGQGTLKGPLNTLELDANIIAPFPVRLQGQVTDLLGDLTWQARMVGEEVALLKIHKNWPDQLFSQVVIDGKGTLEQYALHLKSSAALHHLEKTGNLSVDIQGNFDGLRVDSFHLVHGKTSLAGKGTLTWSPSLSWKAEAIGSHLDPSLVLTDWPGDFSCTLNTTGRFIGNDIEASLHLPQLQGTLRNFPLAGKGEAHLKGMQLQVPQLTISSGGSTLKLHGKAAETVDLSMQLDSNNLAELWPNARGKLHAQGRLTGSPTKPEIDFKLTGANVGQGRDGVGQLTLATKGTLAMDGQLDTTLKAEQLHFGNTSLNMSRLHFQGSMNNHALTFESQDQKFSAGFALQGKIGDKVWQGTLRQAHFSSLKFGNWQQRQETPLSLSTFAGTIKPLCFISPSSSSVCLNGSWSDSADAWQLHGTVSSLPLNSLKNILSSPLPIDGPLSGTLQLSGKKSRIIEGKLRCDATGIAMRVPLADGAEQILKWQKNSLQADYANNQLQATVDSELTDKSTLRMDLRLTNLPLPTSDMMHTPLKGAVQLHVEDLSPVALLSEQMVHLSGALQGQFTVKGTLAEPTITGQMDLANGQAEIPPLGITLAPLSVAIKGDNNRLQLHATAHSGSGYLHAESTLNVAQPDFDTNTVILTGEAFKTVHLPDLDLDLSPDLRVILKKKRIDILGTVTVPKARIKSIDFNNATASSSDMIVVDEEQEAPPLTSDLPLYTSVTVIAGDDVQIDAYGLQGIISGKLQVSSQPDRPQVGNGTLTVQKGSFTLYGKRLKINLGRLLFTGGPLTNPGIELRSENKNDKMTTGVVVEGFLQHPEISFYSSPPMEQSAIIMNMLENTAIGGETRQDIGFIGKTMAKIGLSGMIPYLQGIKKISMIDEIKFEKGNNFDSTSLVFGSWLTPYFYVSYGKNLIEESGNFNTRYTLGKGFYFTTETGASQNGGDVKYEFEH